MAVRIEQTVARAVSSATDVGDAYTRALEAIGTDLEWNLAAAWEPNADGETLGCASLWSRDDDADEFAAVTRTTTFAPGEGLPGAVWESDQAVWVADAATDPRLPRQEAARAAGLHSAVGFPVRSERGVVGVIEGFADRKLEPDQELLNTLEVVGAQLGQLIERRRAEETGVAVERRHRATLEAAIDCVITMDHNGDVLEFNPAAETTFGYTSEEAVGREMATLIVPEELRDRHRRGLRRYLDNDEPVLLDRRIEIEAVRRDGSRFPVELTITRIDVPGAAVFTGHLRDITDRLEAERELRESRTRLVEAADEARRRIERDLHDGAQQQLISVAMTLEAASRQIEESPSEARALLDEAAAELRQATVELRELARGIHPAVLTEGGLDPALRGLASRSKVATTIAAVPERRFPMPVEAAAYFVVAEGLTNVARHADGASSAEVEVAEADGSLVVEVSDDGTGGATLDGSGLRGLSDRVAALGGELEVTSPAGGGTRLRAVIPCGS
ncbi:MAG TPA: PAS domain S-box protein [Solirubrobacterales bacterium]